MLSLMKVIGRGLGKGMWGESSAKNPELSKLVSVKPGSCQNIALHVFLLPIMFASVFSIQSA